MKGKVLAAAINALHTSLYWRPLSLYYYLSISHEDPCHGIPFLPQTCTYSVCGESRAGDKRIESDVCAAHTNHNCIHFLSDNRERAIVILTGNSHCTWWWWMFNAHHHTCFGCRRRFVASRVILIDQSIITSSVSAHSRRSQDSVSFAARTPL